MWVCRQLLGTLLLWLALASPNAAEISGWGSNLAGELGTDAYTPYGLPPTPMFVGTDTSIEQLVLGSHFGLVAQTEIGVSLFGSLTNFMLESPRAGFMARSNESIRSSSMEKLPYQPPWVLGAMEKAVIVDSAQGVFVKSLVPGLGEFGNLEWTRISASSFDNMKCGSEFCIGSRNSSLVLLGDMSAGQAGNLIIDSMVGVPQNVDFVMPNPNLYAVGHSHVVIYSAPNLYAWGGSPYSGTFATLGSFDAAPVDIPPQISGEIVRVACSKYTSMVLTDASGVFTFGDNSYGQLGAGWNVDTGSQPAHVPINGIVVDIAASRYTHFALLQTREVYAWGYNGREEMMAGRSPEEISVNGWSYAFESAGKLSYVSDLGGIAKIITGPSASFVLAQYSVIVSSPGSIVTPPPTDTPMALPYLAWGNNTRGVLGHPSTDRFMLPTFISGTGTPDFGSICSIAMNDLGGIFTTASGFSFGIGAFRPTMYPAVNGNPNWETNRPSKFPATYPLRSFRLVAASSNAFHGWDPQTGTVCSWMANDITADLTASINPTERPGPAFFDVTQFECAPSACFLVNLGRVYSFGWSGSLLGISNTYAATEIVHDITVLDETAGSASLGANITKLALCDHAAMALTAEGRIIVWGNNFAGQFGIVQEDYPIFNGSLTAQSGTPLNSDAAPNQGETFIDIAMTNLISFALTDYGNVYGWGTSYSTDRLLPVPGTHFATRLPFQISASQITSIFAGENTLFLLSPGGNIFSVGQNFDVDIQGAAGILGRNPELSADSNPEPVYLTTNPASLAAKQFAISKNGVAVRFTECTSGPGSSGSWSLPGYEGSRQAVIGWGRNNHGQVGNSFASISETPSYLNTDGALFHDLVTTVLPGEKVTYAISESGKRFVWGCTPGWGLYKCDETSTIPLSRGRTASAYPREIMADGMASWSHAGTDGVAMIGLATDGTIQIIKSGAGTAKRDGEVGASFVVINVSTIAEPVKSLQCSSRNCFFHAYDGTLLSFDVQNNPDDLFPHVGHMAPYSTVQRVIWNSTYEPVVFADYAVGHSFVIGLLPNGTWVGWGRNLEGQLFPFDNSNTSLPVIIDPLRGLIDSAQITPSHQVVSIAAGLDMVAVLLIDEEGPVANARRVVAWGGNRWCQVSAATVEIAGPVSDCLPSEHMTAVMATAFDNINLDTGEFYRTVGAAYQSLFVMSNKGRIWSWGKNGGLPQNSELASYGTLGRDSDLPRGTVQEVTFSLSQQISLADSLYLKLATSPTSGTVFVYNTTLPEVILPLGSVPPVTNNGQACSPSSPGPSFTCQNGQWVSNGDVTLGSNGTSTTITITGPTFINGNLTVPPGTTIQVILPPVGSQSLLVVNGCVVLDGNVEIQLTEEDLQLLKDNKDSRTFGLITSTACGIHSVPLGVRSDAKKNKCVKVSGSTETAPSGNRGSTLNAVLAVNSSSCNRWWIILVSVLCAVVVLSAAGILIWMLIRRKKGL
jgi:alpha-tubulin suppressor-like RCC1 family protein